MNSNNLLVEICLKSGNIPGTFLSSVWFYIKLSFSEYWYITTPAVIIWLFWELTQRNNHNYNSKNGFTPLFNSFVGAGFFCLFQYLTYLFISLFWGKEIICTLQILSILYVIPFILTKIFLLSVRFWKY